MEEEKKEFFTSPQGFKDFIEGGVWRDIKGEIEDLIKIADIALRIEKEPAGFHFLQGVAMSLDDVIVMIELLEEKALAERKEIDDGKIKEPSNENEIDYTLGGKNG